MLFVYRDSQKAEQGWGEPEKNEVIHVCDGEGLINVESAGSLCV